MEICEGGELLERVIKNKCLSENEARNYFRQIMKGISYCHSHKVCHRDLKPENCLFLTKENDSPLVIIDFGLSKVYEKMDTKKHISLQTKKGTLYYMSPEVFQQKYSEKCDIWSAEEPFNSISEEAKDLIKKIFVKESERISALEVLEHPWLKLNDENLGKEYKLDIQVLENFHKSEKLKKVALSYIAYNMNESDLKKLSEMFTNLDVDNDGELSLDEIKKAISTKENDPNFKEIAEIIKGIDTNFSGKVNYHEFIAATMDKKNYINDENLFMTFKMFDKDGNGKISAEELKEVLGKNEMYKNENETFWKNMIKEADKNNDGYIDYAEFLSMMMN